MTAHGMSMALVPEDGPPDTSSFDAHIEAALRRVVDPCSIATGVPIDLVDMGLVLSADRIGRTAQIKLQLTSNVCIQIGIIEARVRDEVGAVDGIDDVVIEVDYDAEWLPSMVDPGAVESLRRRRSFPLAVSGH